jgi:hypothetical protein
MRAASRLLGARLSVVRGGGACAGDVPARFFARQRGGASDAAPPSARPRGAPPGSTNTSVSGASAPGASLAASSDWTRVDGNEGVYWWNEATDETTTVGAARPPPGPLAHSEQAQPLFLNQQQQQQQQQPQSFGGSMMSMAAMGAGMSLAMIVVGSILR